LASRQSDPLPRSVHSHLPVRNLQERQTHYRREGEEQDKETEQQGYQVTVCIHPVGAAALVIL
jgi:hypothetical protein